MDYRQEYRQKLRTPEEAVRIVKDGDWVDYGTLHNFPSLLDAALAKRRDELHGVGFRGNLIPFRIEVAECDPTREHFFYTTWHCSSYERKLVQRGLCNFIPMVYRNLHAYYHYYLDVDVAMVCATPMDKHGYFNLGCTAGACGGPLKKAKTVILEVNGSMPWVEGDAGQTIHISEVDFIVEGEHAPLIEFPTPVPTKEDEAIAEHILPYITDGATLQFGIGGLPDVLGSKIADSDLKDLGMHTELCSNAYLKLHEAGKLTNRKKTWHPGKGVMGLAAGDQALYDWLDHNSGLEGVQLDVVNSAEVIAANSELISINACVSVDLLGQIDSETSGLRQISGTGGQLDYVTGAVMSGGGKSFIAMNSIFKDKDGTVHYRIQPFYTRGDVVSVPRSQVNFIVTEYGAVNLAGRSTWERAERLISIAHPDFRDQLCGEAEKMGIWKRSNKK